MGPSDSQFYALECLLGMIIMLGRRGRFILSLFLITYSESHLFYNIQHRSFSDHCNSSVTRPTGQTLQLSHERDFKLDAFIRRGIYWRSKSINLYAILLFREAFLQDIHRLSRHAGGLSFSDGSQFTSLVEQPDGKTPTRVAYIYYDGFLDYCLLTGKSPISRAIGGTIYVWIIGCTCFAYVGKVGMIM